MPLLLLCTACAVDTLPGTAPSVSQELHAKVLETTLGAEETNNKIRQLHRSRERLTQQRLNVLRKVDCYLARQKPWTAAEAEVRAALVKMSEELSKPTEFQGKLAELKSLQAIQVCEGRTLSCASVQARLARRHCFTLWLECSA